MTVSLLSSHFLSDKEKEQHHYSTAPSSYNSLFHEKRVSRVHGAINQHFLGCICAHDTKHARGIKFHVSAPISIVMRAMVHKGCVHVHFYALKNARVHGRVHSG